MFQFGGQPATEPSAKTVISLLSDDGKENMETDTRRAHSSRRDEGETTGVPAVQSDLPRKDVPSTPGSRLALPDLLGMGDVKRAVLDVSPDERIDWNHGKEDSSHKSGSAFGGVRRAKKRARSSSPVSSSPAQLSKHFPTTNDDFDRQADPGSELWGRYSLNGSNVPTPQVPSVPALAHLMHMSSPQPSRDGLTPRSTFRRANSCGNQFPKRRRVVGSDGDVFTESANIGPSKLAVLIERVQEGLTQPRLPLPMTDTSESPDGLVTSPSRNTTRRAPERQVGSKGAYSPNSLQRVDNKTPQKPPSSIESNSSDYGDFDDGELDESLFDTLESRTEQVLSPRKTSVSKPSHDPPPRSNGVGETTGLGINLAETSVSVSNGDDDEFGDFDEDLLEVDLEQVVSQFDRGVLPEKPARGGTGIPTASKTGIISIADSDDEFGDDDLDEGDFDAVEATVTQSVQPTADGLLPVCTKLP